MTSLTSHSLTQGYRLLRFKVSSFPSVNLSPLGVWETFLQDPWEHDGLPNNTGMPWAVGSVQTVALGEQKQGYVKLRPPYA